MIDKRIFIANALRPFLSLMPATNGVVALTLHNIEEKYYEWFDKFISMVDKKYGFITPEEFNNNFDDIKLKVLLTFDDGFYSNKVVAEQILAKYNVKAIFFITEDFIGLDENNAYEFANNNFYPKSNISNNKKVQQSMNWDEVKWLNDQGHTIGAHTKTHPVLSKVSDKEKLKDEIVFCSQRLEDKLNIQIDTFAFPFGTPYSVSIDALNIAKQHFRYIYSNVRGDIESSPNHFFIFRQNIVPGDPIWLVQNMIEGKLDWRYKKVQDYSHKLFGKL